MAMLENYPTDPRQQPIRIGTAEIVFATRGPEWSEFARDRKHLAGIEFEAAPEKDANEFLNSMKNRVALVARQTLANTRPHYLISDCSVRRGSLIITLDFSVIPANITLILGRSATILYKGLKDYKTIREGTIQVYKDLSFGVTAIADKIASLYKSFEKMEFVQHMTELIKAIGMAAVYEEYRDDPTLFDDIAAVEKKMKAAQEELDERIRKAQAEGRLGGGEKFVVKERPIERD